MAGDAKKLQPIIIKRVKKGGHAAHGGAWKIAYADFVTAMMAFFLLMWLLGSTTEGDKKGIADYFGSPLKVAMQGGSGSGDSSHIVKGGGRDLTRETGQVKSGDVEAQQRTFSLRALKEEQRKAEKARLTELKDKVKDVLASNPQLASLGGQIRLDMTREGLRIQIVDENNRPMFDSGSAVVKPYMRTLLHELGSVLSEVPNRLTLEGHTDAQAFAGGDRGYSKLGVVGGSRQCLAARIDRRRLAGIAYAAGARPGLQQVARCQAARESDQPAHQHHRDEPGCRGCGAEEPAARG